MVPPNGPQSQVWLGDSDKDELDRTGDTEVDDLDVIMETNDPKRGKCALCSSQRSHCRCNQHYSESGDDDGCSDDEQNVNLRTTPMY